MNSLKDNPVRGLIAEMAIGLSVCAGAYAVFVEPAQRDLQTIESKVADLRSKAAAAATVRLDPQQLAAARASARQFAQSVDARSLPARDETSMFKSLSDLATRHRVRIDDLRPAQLRGIAKAQAETKHRAGDAQVAYAFTLVGDFVDATAFLADVQNDLGYSIVQNVRLQPVEDPGTRTVKVAVETEYRGFDTSALATAESAAQQHETRGGDQ